MKFLFVVNSQINRATKGGYFGELALLTKQHRAATVISAGNVKTACKSESEIEEKSSCFRFGLLRLAVSFYAHDT
jgi:CRP-like cAMP-binding protein